MAETWTPERVDELRGHVENGLRFIEIGCLMGLTKNQCLCKATRMGFEPREGVTLSLIQMARRGSDNTGSATILTRLDALHATFDQVLAETRATVEERQAQAHGE